MSAVTRFFFRAPYAQPTTWSVIRWWESRRLAFNLAVGGAGLLSLLAISLTPARGVPLELIAAYAILANLFFCLGPLVDALVCRRWGPNFVAVGPALFRYGFVFAVGLTLLPIPMLMLGAILRVLRFLM
jgi:hypothetical protein